ncbi:MAG: OmpA family protein [Rhizobacter sp.]|nr:OmpA family protein [Rhizobacter sp.]
MQLIRICILLFSMAVAGCMAPQPPISAGCSDESIGRANTATQLREIVNVCLSSPKTEHFAHAITKLNELPAIAGRRIQLQSSVPRAESEQVSFEVDVYFNPLEAYLPESGTEKLDELIERMNSTYMIHSVYIVGRTDRDERDLKSFKVALKRADFVRRYLLAAGVNSSVPFELHEAGPRQPDTLEGRVRDRSASILVIAFRRSSSAVKRAL